MFIKMISDFDCWKYEIEHTLHFKYALEAKDINPFSNIWNHLVRDQNTKGMPLLNEMIDKGIVIEKYMEQWFENYCTSYSYESEINGIKCLVTSIPFIPTRIIQIVLKLQKTLVAVVTKVLQVFQQNNKFYTRRRTVNNEEFY